MVNEDYHYLVYDDCLEDNREYYKNCSVLCCVHNDWLTREEFLPLRWF